MTSPDFKNDQILPLILLRRPSWIFGENCCIRLFFKPHSHPNGFYWVTNAHGPSPQPTACNCNRKYPGPYFNCYTYVIPLYFLLHNACIRFCDDWQQQHQKFTSVRNKKEFISIWMKQEQPKWKQLSRFIEFVASREQKRREWHPSTLCFKGTS